MSIKHEAITVDGTVMYCDGCGAHGPKSAYDNAEDCMEEAERMGWTTDDHDHDLCKKCTADKVVVPAKKPRR